MKPQRRSIGILLMTAAAGLVVIPALTRLRAQEQSPNRREFTITARDYRFNPDRIQVTQDDLVKLTVKSEDVPTGSPSTTTGYPSGFRRAARSRSSSAPTGRAV
jgi:hypothetical protein